MRIAMKSWGGVALSVVALALLLTIVAPRASAQTITISDPNADINGYAGPYATVLIGLTDSTHATITFTSLSADGNIYLMGDGGSVAVNVNAASWTLGSITGSNSGTGFTPGPYSNGGAGTEDGFGIFNQTINSFDGFSHSSDTISFVLTNTGGTWASVPDVLTPNADGYQAAMHVFVTSSPAARSNGAIATGYAADGSPVPEPSTLTLLGTGLLGIAALIRRHKNVSRK